MAHSRSSSTARRRTPGALPDRDDASETETELLNADPSNESPPWSGSEEARDEDAPPGGETFVLTKHLMLRLLGAVYFFANLGAIWQNGPLLGEQGLMPAKPAFEEVQRRNSAEGGSRIDGFLATPSLFWWLPLSDSSMDAVALAGATLSLAVVLGLHSSAAMLLLWLLYFSIVTAAEASSFYSYGWESQLLETGFLAAFLPLLSRRSASPSPLVLWLFRWLSFRISLGAGLIKIRGGSCWEARTCLWYHFETQPIPSPTSFAFHFLPKWVLSRAVDLDLLVQLYASWTVLLPGLGRPLRCARRGAGLLQLGFMLNIAASGNFAFLNHLTLLPSLACLDDACWRAAAAALLRCVPRRLRAPPAPRCTPPPPPPPPPSPRLAARAARAVRLCAHVGLCVVIGWLSWPVLANLLQLEGRQVMNGSFGAFRLVNTYGAFGSVGEARYEPIVSVSHDGRAWYELDFPCKPGNLTRRPCFSAPYHYRLDWNIWFLGFKPHQAMLQRRERWLYALLRKLLQADRAALSLLDASAAEGAGFRDPAPPHGHKAPRLARVDMYHYVMADSLWTLGARWAANPARPVEWWRREYEEALVPPVVLGPGGQLAHAQAQPAR